MSGPAGSCPLAPFLIAFCVGKDDEAELLAPALQAVRRRLIHVCLLQDTNKQGEGGYRQKLRSENLSSSHRHAASLPRLSLTVSIADTRLSCLQALGKLKCTRRVLLSGTPVQNNLDEVSTFPFNLRLT